LNRSSKGISHSLPRGSSIPIFIHFYYFMKGDGLKMKNNFFNIKLALLVIMIALAFFLFTGASQNNESSQVGRYRLCVINRGNIPDLFVIDTATGIVKWLGKDEGKPFEEVGGH